MWAARSVVTTMTSDKPKPQDVEKLKTEFQILQALEKGKMRWKQLKETIPISTRTLADRLKELQGKGVIRRIIDDSSYPPAVYYEKTSNVILMPSPNGEHAQIWKMLSQFRDEERELRKVVTTQLEGNASPEDILEAAIEGYIVDLLFTLRYSIEESKMAPYLVFYHKEMYAARLEHLIEAVASKPELAKALHDMQEKLMLERKKESDKAFEKWSKPFSNKTLAKAIIRLYSQKVASGDEKGNAYEFLSRLIENQELQNELQHQSEIEVDMQELEKIHKEPGWKALNAKSPA